MTTPPLFFLLYSLFLDLSLFSEIVALRARPLTVAEVDDLGHQQELGGEEGAPHEAAAQEVQLILQ
jgi:hypothetical protein